MKTNKRSIARIYDDMIVIGTPVIGGEDAGSWDEELIHNLDQVQICIPFANAKPHYMTYDTAVELLRVLITKTVTEDAEDGDPKACILAHELGLIDEVPSDSEGQDIDEQIAAFMSTSANDDTIH